MDYNAAVQGIYVSLNPQISSKPLISIPLELTIRPPPKQDMHVSDKLQQNAIDQFKSFNEEYTKFKNQQKDLEAELEQVKLKNIAPGLSSSPLVPSSTPNSASSSKITSPAESNPSLNYLEFEQGLPPANPWDTPSKPVDDLKQLIPDSQNQQHHQLHKSSASQSSIKSNSSVNPPLLPRPSSSSSLGSALPSNLSTPLHRVPSPLRPLQEHPTQESAVYNQVVSWGCNPNLVREGMKYYMRPPQLMDYCLVVERHQRAGYSIQEINDAIEVCGKEMPTSQAVVEYLQAYSRVKEVGFGRERVKKALVDTLHKKTSVDIWSQEAVALLLNYN